MKEKITLIDERGFYQFSHAYELEGEQIVIMKTEKIVSMAGTPAELAILLAEPNAIYDNPKKPIQPDKRYLVLIKEIE